MNAALQFITSQSNRGRTWLLLFAAVWCLPGCESNPPKQPSPEAIEFARQAQLRALQEQEAARREAVLRYEMAIGTQLPYLRRMWQVGFPLLQAGAGLCVEQTVPRAGFEYWNRHAFGELGVDYLERHHHLDDTLVVLAVFPGGAAERAGLQEGDVLLSLNGVDIPEGPDSDPLFKKLLRDQLMSSQAAVLVVRRGEKRKTVSIVPQPVCDFDLDFSASSRLNAWSDGKRIAITRGMMDFANGDHELALVISRELAHNLLNHMGIRNGYAFVGGILDVLAATQGIMTQGAISHFASGINAKEFEADADYVGLYLMARAGFAVDATPEFWRRLVERDPGGQEYSALAFEADMPYRKASMRNTIREIEDKRDRGAPLLPDLAAVLEQEPRDITLTNR